MKVSIITPTYNRAHLLPRAIESVLAQTYQDFEMLIIDDGSKDNTKEIVNSYDGPIHYYYQENAGVSAARNYGINKVSGDFIMFLDSDDIIYPRKLELQVKFLMQNPDVDVVYGGWKEFDESGQVLLSECIPNPKTDVVKQLLWEGHAFPIHAALLKRNCVNKIGSFDVSLKASEDTDYWIRIGLAGFKFGCITEYVCQYQTTPGSLSEDLSFLIKTDEIVLKKIFSDPRTSRKIKNQKSKIYGYRYYQLGIFYYSRDNEIDPEKNILPKKYFQKASENDPLIFFKDKRLHILIANKALKYQLSSPESYIITVLKSFILESEKRKQLQKKIAARINIIQAFDHFSKKERKLVLRKIITGVLLDFTWIKNRGVLSIFFKSLFPKFNRA